MPSTSPKQKRFMAAAAHNPKFAKEAGISQTVAREFHNADQKQKRRASVEKAFKAAKRRHT